MQVHSQLILLVILVIGLAVIIITSYLLIRKYVKITSCPKSGKSTSLN